MKAIWNILKWTVFLPITLLVLWLMPSPAEAKSFNEQYFTEQLANNHGFDLATGTREFRPDLMRDGVVVEVDWEKKIYEGIGQSLVYAHEFKRAPGIVILNDKMVGHNIDKYLPAIHSLNVKVWIANVCKDTGVIYSVTHIEADEKQ